MDHPKARGITTPARHLSMFSSNTTPLVSLSKVVLCLLTSSLLASSCGGGGGGESDLGPAIPQIRASPLRLDSGNDTRVSVDLNSISSDDILVKFRFPRGLRYVRNSARIFAGKSSKSIAPSVLALDFEQGGIMAFRVSRALRNEEQYARIEFRFRGVERVEKGTIEVDVDLNDPTLSDAIEFSFAQPRFTAESETQIEVLDDSPPASGGNGGLAPIGTSTPSASQTPAAATSPTAAATPASGSQ
jgi:hypothetical protein